ncbi:MAG TPA: YhjD/YihY/BrkB family envelope integrity protein [Gaiellaceae bacterium]|nr:YhjD/YihY/BrkB family envelope integrity protein [Gaiellaceae bacterium]
MPEEPAAPGTSGAGKGAGRAQSPVSPSGTSAEQLVGERSRIEAVRERWARVEASAAGKYWSHLSAVDFMNSSFAFAALAVLCAFPFLAIVLGATGGDVRQAIVARMGLNTQATRDVDAFISAGNRAVATLTVFGGAVLVLGAIGMASTLQTWYQRIYDQPPMKGVFRQLPYQVAGVVAFSAYIGGEVLIFHAVRAAGGGRVLIWALTFVFATLFWWCSAYFLLFSRVAWRKLLPAGVATGALITGLGIFSSFVFSSEIVSGQQSYGAAGVALGLISYLVGFGVCLHLGAVFGRMWIDWQAAGVPAQDQDGPA